MGYKIKDAPSKSSATADPVHYVSGKERFLFFVEKNRGMVWGGILFVIILIAVIVVWGWLNQQKEEQAWVLQGQAQDLYLDRPLDDVQKGQENVQQASKKFKNVLDEFPGTASAKVSLFLLGNSWMEEEKYQEAIDAYTSFIQQYSHDPISVGLVQQRLAFAYLRNGNQKAAKEAFEAVLGNPQALNKDQVLIELAKLAEADERTTEAVEHYKTIIQDFPFSPFASEAELRVEVLAPEEVADSPASALESPEVEEKPDDGSERQADQNGEGK